MTIFGIGTVVVDHVVELPGFPAADSKVEVVNDWRQVGGPVPVALSTAAFYGTPAAFAGRWGDDEAGRYIQQTLSARNIHLPGCESSKKWRSGFAHVWVDAVSGSRTIAYSRGSFPVLAEHDINENVLSEYDILHLDGWAGAAAIKAAKIMRANGGTVVLDAGSVKPQMQELLPLVHVLIASQLFRNSQFGSSNATDEQLLSLGIPNVITTDGSHGATWITDSDRLHEPALQIKAIDTNGAGDVFSGALLHALASGWNQQASLKFANQVAGYACQHRGNSSLPRISELSGSEFH